MKRLMFTKMVGQCSWEEVAAHAKALGFDGLDLTCRNEGHVLPENVKTDLPKAVEFFRARGLEVPMISTGITSGEEFYAKDLFDTAGQCGIKYVKMGYWWLADDCSNFNERFEDAKRGVDKVEQLARAAGVCAMIHIHSGNCISSIPAVVKQLLEGRDSKHMGAYMDIGHMVVEGGSAGWMIGMNMLAPYLKLVAVKSFTWKSEQCENYVKWFWRVAPLEGGIVPWPKVYTMLKDIGYDGYISIHSEYLDDNSWKVLNQAECLAQTAEDLKYLDSINFR